MSYYDKEIPFETLKGKTIEAINVTHDEIVFVTNDGTFRLYHEQDCCESVTIESVEGDISDLLHTPILDAEDYTNNNAENTEDYESFTWTFYRLATIKGYVTIRWVGVSNGYYSESVSFIKL